MTAGLTPSQLTAVEHFEGPLLVLAGPGSGKTRVITFRIARLLERGVLPDQILALTFTNKAAREMAERVDHLLGGLRVRVSTFHRFCSRLLRRWPEPAGLKSNFSILDQSDQTTLVRQIMKDLNLDSAVHEPGRVLNRISRSRNELVSSEQFQRAYEQRAGSPLDAVVYQVFPEYERRVREQNSVDFDDLLLHVVAMLDGESGIREALDEQFRFILVDEYQDTNLAQYRIVQAISQQYRNLCVTGDPDQSIYGWRGARPANITAFEKDFPDRSVVTLDQNFRSTQRIVRCADTLISVNRRPHRGRLTTDNAEGTPVVLRVFENSEAEADGIASEIVRLVDSGEYTWGDFAVFYRVNALSRAFETAFTRFEIPYQIASGFSFFERAEVRDLIAYLRLIENQSDDSAFERIVNRPARGIGNTSLLRLRNYAAKNQLSLFSAACQAAGISGISSRTQKALKSFTDLILILNEKSSEGRVAPVIERLISEIDYLSLWQDDLDEIDEDRAANVYELISTARQYDSAATSVEDDEDDQKHMLARPTMLTEDGPSLQGFLELATLSSEADSIDSSKGAVSLMTLHASKGLEFPCVFVSGLETGLIPHERAVRDGHPGAFEEERRLLFVGITRAMQRLVLTQTSERFFRGVRRTTISSPFIMELQNTVVREGTQATPHAVTAAMLDERLEQARRRFEAAQKFRDRPLLMTGSQLANQKQVESEATDDTGETTFRRGMLVRHPRYGRGTIVAVSGGSHRATVTVEFENSGESHTFVAARCPLQPVGM